MKRFHRWMGLASAGLVLAAAGLDAKPAGKGAQMVNEAEIKALIETYDADGDAALSADELGKAVADKAVRFPPKKKPKAEPTEEEEGY